MFSLNQIISFASGKLIDFLNKNNGEKELSLEEVNHFLKDHKVKVLIGSKDGKSMVKIKKLD